MPSCWKCSCARTSVSAYRSGSMTARAPCASRWAWDSEVEQHVRCVRVAALAGGLEQGMLELALAPLETGPVQQPVRIEGVPGTTGPEWGRADGRATLAQGGLGRRDVARRYLAQGADTSRPSGPSAGFSSKGWKLQFHRNRLSQPFQGPFQAVQADRAPGARHVGHKVDSHAPSLTTRAPLARARCLSGPAIGRTLVLSKWLTTRSTSPPHPM